ncbi:sce7726 family protein [Listeria booriae]|nr:sce7726 family protein [Listeria booriae]MBC1565908.1 sce7726 family protein [Listeria booriae]MBC1907176.1 sce7726 family protein [Listeria booriae]MBC1912592.1 sce7726 family protein [Listeria booriae]STY40397.1 Uncharacterised protein [Listeria booriae]
MKLYDIDIRNEVKKRLNGYKDCAILEEVKTSSGHAIADVVAVNGHINAYEIKSDKDSLTRLSGQVKQYDENFERNIIVVGEKYEKSIDSKVPDYWGIIVASNYNGKVRLSYKRQAKLNPNISFFAFLDHLSAKELRSVVVQNDFLFARIELEKKDINRLFKQDLIVKIESKISKKEKQIVKRIVRETIKGRT